MLESSDVELLRSIFQCPTSTPTCVMYLDLQCIPIGFLIRKRRALFLHYVLNQNPDSLLYSVFASQRDQPLCGDFRMIVKSDMEYFQIYPSFDQIRQLLISKYRLLVTNKLNEIAFTFLIKQK